MRAERSREISVLRAIYDVVNELAGAGVAGFDETGIAHPGALVALRQGLADGPADEFGHRHTKGSRLSLDQGVVLFGESDLRADHIIPAPPSPDRRSARAGRHRSGR